MGADNCTTLPDDSMRCFTFPSVGPVDTDDRNDEGNDAEDDDNDADDDDRGVDDGPTDIPIVE